MGMRSLYLMGAVNSMRLHIQFTFRNREMSLMCKKSLALKEIVWSLHTSKILELVSQSETY